jgi:NAD(P)-dependent dehydrogenase (short-subunit alcohol dehydrogenase family)
LSRSAVVFGASGGIGAALVAALAASGDYGRIHAGARRPPPAAPGIAPFAFDLTDEASIAAAAERIGAEGPVDLAIVATGVLVGPSGAGPEKSWRGIAPAAMAEMFAINTVGPAMIGRHFLPLLPRAERCVFAALSARVGSIGDNALGGWHSYRASKAALNMLVRNFAIELAQRNRQGIAVALHPGTVDTPLSRPFQRGVPTGQLFTPEVSAAHLLKVIAGLVPADSGGLFAWDGQRIAY